MLTRRGLFGALAGAVAALCGVKAVPKWVRGPVIDAETGISVRFIRAWAPAPAPTRFDVLYGLPGPSHGEVMARFRAAEEAGGVVEYERMQDESFLRGDRWGA